MHFNTLLCTDSIQVWLPAHPKVTLQVSCRRVSLIPILPGKWQTYLMSALNHNGLKAKSDGMLMPFTRDAQTYFGKEMLQFRILQGLSFLTKTSALLTVKDLKQYLDIPVSQEILATL